MDQLLPGQRVCYLRQWFPNPWRLELHAEFEDAFTHTGLPERPDYETANRFLIEARRAMAKQEGHRISGG